MRLLATIFSLMVFGSGAFGSTSNYTMEGIRANGVSYYDNEVVRFFAGEFQGGFSYADCTQAAGGILAQYRQIGSSLATNKRNDFQLAPNHRYFLFGYVNETANYWYWDCINMLPGGTSTQYFRSNSQGLYSTRGWVKQPLQINGYAAEMGFADNDAGGLAFYTVTP